MINFRALETTNQAGMMTIRLMRIHAWSSWNEGAIPISAISPPLARFGLKYGFGHSGNFDVK